MTNYRKKLLWLYARKRGSGSGGISVSVSGTTPVTLANAIESAIRHMTQFGKLTQSGTPTTANPVDIVCNNGALKWDSENQRIYADGTPEVLTVSADDVADQTASVENLLAVGNVRDEQDIITGKVIRRTEAFVYDGTQTVKPTFMSTTGAATEGAIIVQPRGAEYAGDVVSFEAEEGKNIDSLKVTLTPKQEGTGDPSPDNIRPITGTEQAEVVRCGKNLFPYETVPAYAYAWYNGSKAMADATQPVLLKGGTNYILSAERDSEHATSTWLFLVRAWYTDGTILTADDLNVINLKMYGASYGYEYQATPQYFQSLQTTDGTPLTLAPTKDVVVDIRMQSNKGIGVNPMLEVGTEATTYEPYDPQSTTLEIEWGADVGTIYGGTLDVVQGVLTVDRAMVDMGTIAFAKSSATSSSGGSVFSIPVSSVGLGMAERARYTPNNILSDVYKTASTSTWWISELLDLTMLVNTNALVIADSRYSTAADFRAAVSGVQLVYELSTPIHISIDPQTLTALAHNTVWADAGPVDVLLNDELVETVAKQPLKTAEGDNTVSVVSEVGEVELAVTYKGGSE